MGPSGCGKSTLLNLVAGLDAPPRARSSWPASRSADKDENALARMRRRHIGIVFQFFNLLEGMSVLENVTLPAVIAGTGRQQAESRARDLLDMLGLADKAKAPPACSPAVSASAWPSPAPWPTAHAAAGRRADGSARLGGRPRGPRAVPPAAHRRPGHPARHPRRAGGRDRPPGSCACATAGSKDEEPAPAEAPGRPRRRVQRG